MSWIKKKLYETKLAACQKKKQRQFLSLLAIIIVLIEGVYFYKYGNLSDLYLYNAVGVLALLLVLFIWPKISKWPLFLWLCFGLVLSEISSFIIFGIVYFLIFFPIRIIRGDRSNKGGWSEPEENTTMQDQF